MNTTITYKEYSNIDKFLLEDKKIDKLAKKRLRSFNNNNKTLKHLNKRLTKVDIQRLWRELGQCEKE